jgi:type IV pilus assembly protein PilV
MSAVSRRSQRGVGLIEVLIALLVLSFGMLGLAGLQMWSLRYNQSAMERGMAVVQTHSIVDAMRANRGAATTAGFNREFGDEVPEGEGIVSVTLRTWLESLPNDLGPGADGEIDCDGTLCTISVRWNDSRANREGASGGDEDGGGLQTVTTDVQL